MSNRILLITFIIFTLAYTILTITNYADNEVLGGQINFANKNKYQGLTLTSLIISSLITILTFAALYYDTSHDFLIGMATVFSFVLIFYLVSGLVLYFDNTGIGISSQSLLNLIYCALLIIFTIVFFTRGNIRRTLIDKVQKSSSSGLSREP